MKTIKLKFTDFWKGFDIQNNTFLTILNKNYNVVLSDKPDYIIFSSFGYDYLKHDSLRIFYTAENIRPDFNLCDYAIAFDWMIFEDRYLRYPVYMLYDYDLEKAKRKHNISTNELRNKRNFCNFIYSNHNAHPAREEFFRLLNSYKKVDSGGKFLNNLGYYVKNKVEFQSHYKFSIAFENSSASGYTTEKIIQAFAAETIPIYWGNPNISKEFNNNSFINCHEYAGFDDVIQKVIEIDTNAELYEEMIKTPIYKNIATQNIVREDSIASFLNSICSQEIQNAYKRAHSLHSDYYEKLRIYLQRCR